MSSLEQSFILMMDAPLTLSHPAAVASLSCSLLGLLAAGGVFWLRQRLILPGLLELRAEQRLLRAELAGVRRELGALKADVSDGLETLSALHQQARLLTLLRIVLSIALLLGRTGVLALIFRFLQRHIWWQTLAREGVEELAARLEAWLKTP